MPLQLLLDRFRYALCRLEYAVAVPIDSYRYAITSYNLSEEENVPVTVLLLPEKTVWYFTRRIVYRRHQG
jgi:hypothetical protein